jgi:hypothetical protein
MRKFGPRSTAHAQSGLMVLTTLGSLRRAAFVTQVEPSEAIWHREQCHADITRC